jgi:formyltetrahydrofolate synthetase
MERIFIIKRRYSGLKPKVAVIVATVRALKMHGGPTVSAGKPLQKEYTEENVELLEIGCVNLQKHNQNAKKLSFNVVVAVNKFKTHTAAEIEAVRKAAKDAGAFFVFLK